MSGAILECRGLSKQFGKVAALNEVNLAVPQKEILGLLGPNGAGKTTLIKCLLRLIRPSGGDILFKSRQITDEDIQHSFSYLPESFQLFRELNAKEILGILAGSLGKNSASVREALAVVGLEDDAAKKIKAYSRGMQQRLGLAICLIKDPQIIVLDDPFLGLDIIGQVAIIKIIRELKQKEKTVVFSSHTLAQVEKIVDAVAIIDKGRIRFQGSADEFVARHRAVSLEEAFLSEIGYEKNYCRRAA